MIKRSGRCLRCISSTTSAGAQHNSEKIRINPVGIQHLSESLQRQLFPNAPTNEPQNSRLIKLSQIHLANNELLGKKTAIVSPISFNLPKLQGQDLDEHFHRLGEKSLQGYIELVQNLLTADALPPPKKWEFQSGWTRYVPEKAPERVPYPLEDALVFDVETMYNLTKYSCMATCVSDEAWYAWVSPYLTGESKKWDHLIPMDTHSRKKVIVGHNVSYDRARIKEEYSMVQSKAFFLDTMSLHVAVSGMCSRQRGTWLKYRKSKEQQDPAELLDQDLVDDPWLSLSSINSLAAVANLHCDIKMDKQVRDDFGSTNVDEIRSRFQILMNYCSSDTAITLKVFRKIYPQFRQLVPHPVSLAALRHIGQSFLPTNSTWEDYIHGTEQIYKENTAKIEKNLHRLCMETVKLKDNPANWDNDPWLSQLDWTIDPIRTTKSGEPYKNQKLPGYPAWYKQLVVKDKLKLSTRIRIAPLLLKLTWDNHPIYWLDTFGWCFRVPISEQKEYENRNYTHLPYEKLRQDPNFELVPLEGSYFKVPHNDGPQARTTSLMTKAFLAHFEQGTLASKYDLAKEALDMAVSSSYWTSSRERIMNQFVVYDGDAQVAIDGKSENGHRTGVIIPQIVGMGTITRRSVENTWLTASNAKKTRLGSELKSKVTAPKGYCFVGADVDSEELWIASLVGDSVFKVHGGTAIGWMTLEGTKSEGTDLHSKTASILGISRNDAKVFNYGRIYGAGLKFATTLLKKFNPKLVEKEASTTAKALYAATKGSQSVFNNKKMWYGGSESIVFNRLEEISEQDQPLTPVLGAGITAALQKGNLNANSFLPSRINWAIQSSGVDYLHLLVSSMEYLCEVLQLEARLVLTIHDEIRYMCKEEQKYETAMALQIANLWTRAMFCQQMGINEVPQGCAFFSAVDIDHVLRKEVDLSCVTPSNPVPIPHGESLDVVKLLEKSEVQRMLENVMSCNLNKASFTKRRPVLETLDLDLDKTSRELLVNLQISKNEAEFKNLRKVLKKKLTLLKTLKERKKFEADYMKIEDKLLFSSDDHELPPHMTEERIGADDLKELIRDLSEGYAQPAGKPISEKSARAVKPRSKKRLVDMEDEFFQRQGRVDELAEELHKIFMR